MISSSTNYRVISGKLFQLFISYSHQSRFSCISDASFLRDIATYRSSAGLVRGEFPILARG